MLQSVPGRLPFTRVACGPVSRPVDPEHRVITTNKKARYRFEILDELEVGVALVGTEVKSLRGGLGSIQEAYIKIVGDEMWLVGAHIPEYAFGNSLNHVPTRDRKLLAHRREIQKWSKRVREKGLTLVPLELYFKGSRVKLQVALVRGKRLHDKRQAEREKSDRREMERDRGRRR